MAMAGSVEEEAARAALKGSALAVVSLGGGEGREVVDPAQFWGDEERVKRELVAWAKAVASMAVHHAAFELRRCDCHRR